ncbi:methyltransferase domain-containing protein [Candidatus Pseudothioglobus singularis]|nr:methyltransferase domain-containing protein [Candidatus Pseudothioglobus singularis]
MIQQDPIPPEDAVNEYYSNEYREDYKKTFTPKTKHVYRAGKLALERIKFLKERNILQGSLLDVGAGGGEFTYLSSKLGFTSEGIEPNVGYSNFARKEYGINIQTGHLSDIHQKFDLITMFHALEHIPNPIKNI